KRGRPQCQGPGNCPCPLSCYPDKPRITSEGAPPTWAKGVALFQAQSTARAGSAPTAKGVGRLYVKPSQFSGWFGRARAEASRPAESVLVLPSQGRFGSSERLAPPGQAMLQR